MMEEYALYDIPEAFGRQGGEAGTRSLDVSQIPTVISTSVYQAINNKEPAELLLTEYINPKDLETSIHPDSSSSRTVYCYVSSRQSPKLTSDVLRPGKVELVSVIMTLKDVEDAEVQFDRWYEEEHIDLLSKVPGWLRTQRFKTSSHRDGKEAMYLALHEYQVPNGLGGSEHQASMSTSWREEIMNTVVKDKFRRTYRLVPHPRLVSVHSGACVE